MYSKIEDIIHAFSGLKILVIGDVMIDAYHWGKVERISPEAPVPIVNLEKKETRLGGAANVAINVKSLGAAPIICSVVGNDEDGSHLLSLMQSHDMDISGILVSEHRKTTSKTRILSGHQQILRIDHESETNLTFDETDLLFEKISLLAANCHAVVFEDYDKGVITKPLIEKCVPFFHSLNIPICVDPKRKNFLLYKNVTLFKPNFKELKEGLKKDFEPSDLQQLKEALHELNTLLKASKYLITLSDKGVYLKTATLDHHLAAHVREIADVSGAGDTVISVAALCLALKLDDLVLAQLANLAGGLVCEHLGVVPISSKELIDECRNLNIFS